STSLVGASDEASSKGVATGPGAGPEEVFETDFDAAGAHAATRSAVSGASRDDGRFVVGIGVRWLWAIVARKSHKRPRLAGQDAPMRPVGARATPAPHARTGRTLRRLGSAGKYR